VTWIRLRQIALVARDLAATLDDLHAVFGLEVAFRDPGVATFGLENAVLPVGNQFIEVVSPTREGTAGGRQLDRLGGDGGYMVICHADDLAPIRARAQGLGIRAALEADDHGYTIWQLHPGDTGGTFLEIDFQPGGEDASGPWMPAGPDWQRARRTHVVDGITAVEVRSSDADKVAARWSEVIGTPVHGGAIALDNATVHIVPGAAPDALVGITLSMTDRDAALDAARARSLMAADGTITICGVQFTV
jgi:catechol 2,3-dioxygenase-like lactoylglutathione lyase family enzyme